MAAVSPFPKWLPEVAADSIRVLPGDAIAEARGNLWTFGLDDEQRSVVERCEVEDFIRAVVEARRDWLQKHGAMPMRFYCWYDAQADQLRFSLISASGDSLPFECPLERVADLGIVVGDWLSAEHSVPLRVWVRIVP